MRAQEKKVKKEEGKEKEEKLGDGWGKGER